VGSNLAREFEFFLGKLSSLLGGSTVHEIMYEGATNKAGKMPYYLYSVDAS
jgi:hypothetical protein